ncbi:MAG: endonuclease V [bacterium]|nr:endonuclease V [bacterium]
MKDPLRHPWNLSPRDAVALQNALRRKVRLRPRVHPPRTVAGVDISYPRFGRRAVAGVILLDFPELCVLEEVFAVGEMPFPYVPGLLSFREGPLMEQAFRKLRRKPDLILFDGQGIAHPRGLGLAAHLGLRWATPSIGCGKSRLFGEGPEPADRRGAWAALHGPDGERVGARLRTRQGVKPIFISPGHRVSLEKSIDWVMQASPRYRLPEPIRQAHRRTNEERIKRGITA